MSGDSLDGRIPAVLVGVLCLVNGLWNVGTRAVAYWLGGLELTAGVATRGVGPLDVVVLLSGVVMIAAAVGLLLLGRAWGWPAATLAFGVGLAFSVQELVVGDIAVLTVGMALLNAIVVGFGLQREAFAELSLPTSSSV